MSGSGIRRSNETIKFDGDFSSWRPPLGETEFMECRLVSAPYGQPLQVIIPGCDDILIAIRKAIGWFLLGTDSPLKKGAEPIAWDYPAK
jgi:hypothetical protein